MTPFNPIDYALHYGGRCRDCADADGVCPTSGMPCDPAEARRAASHCLKAWVYGVKHGFMANPLESDLASPAEVVDPLGHISAYGLEKLQTRRHYCVSVSHEAEKEYTIPVYLHPPQQEPARLREALEEVMEWVISWDPPFTDDEEWPATRARVEAALAEGGL